MDRFARTVLGYHGCDPAFAEKLLSGEVPINDWKPSTNDYDWLGHGIYFWEYAPERAFQTLRCPFLEGVEVYPDSMIRSQSHVQLVVKSPANILGVFRPNLSAGGRIP